MPLSIESEKQTVNPRSSSTIVSGTIIDDQSLSGWLPFNTDVENKVENQTSQGKKKDSSDEHLKTPEVCGSGKMSGSELSPYQDSGSSYRPDDCEDERSTDTPSDTSKNSIVEPFANIIFTDGALHSNEDIEIHKTNDTIMNPRRDFNFNGTVDRSKKHVLTNKRIWDKKDVCIFCEKAITNFTRHLKRNHSEELEVAKYLSLKKDSAERKTLADQLRKRGNFFNNVSGVPSIKPVRRPNQRDVSSIAKHYLPCKFCFGHFKKGYLRRHVKICQLNDQDVAGKRRNIQAEAQALLLTFTEDDNILVQNVFPRMTPDDISIIVKADALIRAFGTRYIKCHKEKHLVSVVSCKMRELGRFLAEMRKMEINCHTLMDCLKPTHFDFMVKATRIGAGYDPNTDTFKSPSFVLKIGTSLKQCCDIAEFLLLKGSPLLRRTENVENDIRAVKTVAKLVEKQWSYELSTNACKEIYQNKWNKPAMLPLTSDIKVFRDHLIAIQNKSLDTLKRNASDLHEYKILQESVLAQLILLNRKRAGEVQRILLSTYINASTEAPQEEITLSLSPVERELTKILKRIVIRGKRGRGVPILFTPKIQKAMSIIISLRHQFCSKANEYLFALPNTEHSCLRASDVIRKLAVASGAKNPSMITSTKLRKQVATVAQILNFSESDIEQLATFMGHNKDIHKTFYRLPENVFQVAKVSKFLMMMENGTADKFRGKNLDEININVDGLVSDESNNSDTDISTDEESRGNESSGPIKIASSSKAKTKRACNEDLVSLPSKVSQERCRKKNQRLGKKHSSQRTTLVKNIDRISWTDEQKKITKKFFEKHILLKKPPKKSECEELISKHPNIMKGFSWKKIKTFIYNIYRSNPQRSVT